ncbi:MFS transporter [Micrococcus lacusdianchii]|uniref:MFS transporter n=1 Tax=Micrococcus lacusdianchii TaxID=2915940 RepID=UPI002004E4B4|nr:MFS transporter [Micrococcus sp. JXJ CY 30]
MQIAEQERIASPTFVLAWVVSFLQFLAFYALVTTMAVYAVRQFAASDAGAGLASSAFVIGATLSRVVTGHVVDRFGKRRVLVVALVAVALSCTLYLIASSLPALVAVRMLHGASYAFASTAVMALAQAAIPDGRRAEATGHLALGTTLATAIGPALGLFLAGSIGYAWLFRATLGITVVSLVLGLLVREAPAAADVDGERAAGEVPLEHPAPAVGFRLRSVLHPAVLPISGFMLLVGLSYAGILTYLNAYSVERGLTAGAGLCFTAALLVLAFATRDGHVVLAGALSGLGYGTLMPAAQAIAVNAVPSHQLGAGISTLMLFADVGLGLGPVLLGGLVASAGYGAMYAALAGVLVIAAGYYFVMHGRRHGRRGTVARA